MTSSSNKNRPIKNGQESIDWMYEGNDSKINTEDYLTGRKIDRHFDRKLNAAESKNDSTTLFNSKVISKETSVAKGHVAGTKTKTGSSTMLDIQTIKTEDPLVAIKVREEQFRREILSNPIKMKRLQKIVVTAMRKKIRRSLKKQGQLPKFVETFRQKFSDNNNNNNVDFSGKNLNNTQNEQESCSSSSDNESSENSSDEDSAKKKRQKASFGLVYPNSVDQKRKENFNHSSSSPVIKRGNEDTREKRKVSPSAHYNKRQKLTEEEMERKRREMQENARWRESQREAKVKKFEREEKHEAKNNEDRREKVGAQFLKPMISRAMDNRSMEERVKSKKQSLQRGYNAMDSNFVRK